MTSRERVVRTLMHKPVDRAPRELWALPGVLMDRAEEYAEVVAEFEWDFAGPDYSYGTSRKARGEAFRLGEYTDAWGSTWHVAENGVTGEVREPAIPDWSFLSQYRLPYELLDGADLSRVNAGCAATDKFVKAGTETRPFERLQFLCGTEKVFLDLAYEAPELFRLLDMLHEFYCREMRMWAVTDVDGVSFMDDWGTQNSLLISPKQWRQVFKPLYKDYCDILHSTGKYVFFHSDGHISDIYPDLIEIGVDAINSQLFCMDIEAIGAEYKGRVTFWGELDRQWALPFGSTEDVRAAVRRVRTAMDDGRGGVIAQCEWGLDTPPQNIEAAFDEWSKPLARGNSDE